MPPVPILLAIALSAILLFPKLAASAWESGSNLVTGMPDQDALGVLASAARLFALALPVVGIALLAQRPLWSSGRRAWGWSAGSAPRRGLVLAAAATLAAVCTWAWWPAGQHTPVRPTDDGTLVRAVRSVSAPTAVARPGGLTTTRLAPGRHLAVALIPRGGPTAEHPALYVVRGDGNDDEPAILVSPDAPDPRKAPSLDEPAPGTAPAADGPSDAPSTPTGPATQLPFKLPDKAGPGDSQALATNTTGGAIVYDVAYSLVTVSGGSPVENENSAYALASCKACTTLAVSFQLVLIVGHSDEITPINVAEALNLNCPECITTAIAKQLVISLHAAPSEELLRRLTAELEKLDAIDTSDPPADVLAQVDAVSDAIQRALDESGLTYPKATPTPALSPVPEGESATPTPTSSATPDASASPSPSASPTATATPTPTATATPTPTETPTATP